MNAGSPRPSPIGTVARMLALPVLLAVLLPRAPAFAQIECRPRAIDFGERGHDERPAETLILRNVGASALAVGTIRPNCDCIRVEPSEMRDPIPPGGSVELVVSMSSGRAIGTMEKSIAIEVPTGPALKVPVSMRVHPGLELKPRDLRFEGVFGGDPVVQHVAIALGARGAGPLDLRSGGVRDPAKGLREDPHFEVTVGDVPGGGKRIEVTLKPTHPEGRIHAQLEARLNGRLLVIPISGEMFRWIKVVPTYFNFSRVSEDDPSSYAEEAILTSTDGREFRILSMDPSFRTLKPEGTRLDLALEGGEIGKPATRHAIRATIVPPTDTEIPRPAADGTIGNFYGQVIVKTDHPERPRIVFSVFGFLAPPRRGK